jgi:hypothetical protein
MPRDDRLKSSKPKKQYLVALLFILLLAIAAFGILRYSNTVSQPVTTPTTTISSTTTMASYPSQFTASHVIIILLENKNGSELLGNKDAPYINKVLIPNYSIAERYYAVGHPSLPNYIAITSGTTFSITNNEYPVESLPYKNLVDLFSEHNITWKAYMESMPSNQKGSCNNELSNAAGGVYGYFTKHNPFVYYMDIMSNLTRCNRIVPLTQFSIDLANDQLPEFSFIAPNILDEGHTTPLNMASCAPSGTTMQCADNWLGGFLPQVINNPTFTNTIIFITWDESDKLGNQTTDTNPNYNVPLIVVSPHSKKGFADNTTVYSHYSLLATVEKIYGLGNLGRNDITANVISDLFTNNTI